MKRIITVAAVMLLLLAGCGKDRNKGIQTSGSGHPDSEAQIQINDITDGNEEPDTDAGVVQDAGAKPDAGVEPDVNVKPDVNTEPEAEQTLDKAIINEAAWCVYWDPNSVSAAAGNHMLYNELVLFGCIYSEDNKLIIPEQLDELISKLPDEVTASDDTELYISFINDVMHPDGSSTQKSTDFLKNVLSDARLSESIIEDMIKQTRSFGFDGIELDYENIHKCDGLWDEYLDFVSRLYKRALEEDLKLRVVFTVSTPADELDFIKGPRYVVMCYNLYGTHSGPGPKADAEFLKNTYRKFKKIDASYAFANGGFEWGPDDKTVCSLTAEAAAALAAEYGADVVREDSGALKYTYQADDGIHTVFYGDELTIKRWSDILLENADEDVRIDLWRLE